jgi:hypothetical protein
MHNSTAAKPPGRKKSVSAGAAAETLWRFRRMIQSGDRGHVASDDKTNAGLPVFPNLGILSSSSRNVATVDRRDDGVVKKATKWLEAAGAPLPI